MNQQLALLKALDIPVWIQKTRKNEIICEEESFPSSGTHPPVGPLPIVVKLSSSLQPPSLDLLKECVANCQLCPLHKSRTQTVFGIGNTSAKIMIIGEAPGFNEDQQGEPFVGRAGQLLNAMLQSIGLERSDIYIANILKCRPPNNRDPLPEEVAQCTPYLQQQIALIQPKILCAVGRIAAHYLLNTTLSLGKLRGKAHMYGESKLPLFITYHPAYLLRNPSAKADAYRDLLQLTQLIAQL